MKLIVMAGGLGTKLWPMSRDSLPKQYQPIIGEKTLFQSNVETLLQKYSPQDIFISTNEQYLEYAKQQAPLIPLENYIVEPTLKKDTGPASGYATLKVAMRYPDEPIMFYVQPVVIREPAEKYLEMIEGIEELVRRENKLVSGGNRPRYPDEGSDYLQLGKSVAAINGLEVYEIEKFINKLGDYNKTKELIESFKVSTHCNHYTAYPALLFESIKQYRPDWYEVLMEIKTVLGTQDEYKKVCEIYKKFEAGRIEVVTQHMFNDKKGLIVILPFKWTHISTWNDIYEYFTQKDEVYKDGQIIDIDTTNTLIKGKKGKIIATIGVDDLVIVDTEDALLVCAKDRTGDIKKVLDQIKDQGLSQYL